MELDADFIRYFGLSDGEDEQKESRVKMLGEANLGVRADASLLAISNRAGVVFVAMPGSLRWGRVAALRRNAKEPATLTEVPCTDTPLVLQLNCDETLLALATATDAPAVLLFEVDALLKGRFPRSLNTRPALQPS